MSRFLILFATTLSLSLLAAAAPAQTIHHVDADAVGFNDGTSWADAFTDLQFALAVDSAGDEIRVAQGTYVPGPTPLHTFTVDPGVTLNGGYAGDGEPNPGKRDIDAYPTILSGDVLGDDLPNFINRIDNCRTVVTGGSGSQPIVIRGFTIRGGNSPTVGGGIYSTFDTLTLHRVTLTENHAAIAGGGLYIDGGILDMLKCDVVDNRVNYPPFLIPSGKVGGGGVFSLECANTIVACRFELNTVLTTFDPNVEIGGGGAALEGSTMSLVQRCEFISNYVGAAAVFGGRGGGLGMLADSGIVSDCVFVNNEYDAPAVSSVDGGGGAWLNGIVRVSNCRFLGNLALQASGGGLAVGDVWGVPGFPPAVENCEFSGNVAGWAGGAYLLATSSSPIPLSGSSVVDNWASNLGGGVFIVGAADLDNNILWANTTLTASGEAAQIHIATPSPVTVDHCDVDGLTGALGGVGNIGLNPQLADADGADNSVGTLDDDLHLLAGSPCIDAGNNAGILPDWADLDCDGDQLEGTPLDVGGLVRRSDDPFTPDTGAGTPPLVDMGAHEYGSALPTQQWANLGSGLAGTYGAPVLDARGTLCAGKPVLLTLSNALENSSTNLIVGFLDISVPFKGGTLVPSADILYLGLPTGAFGTLPLAATWPELVPSGATFYMQHWVSDPAGPVGFSASNAVSGTTP